VLAGQQFRTATVTAIDDMQLAVLQVADYLEVAARFPSLENAVAQSVTARRSLYERATSRG